MSTPLKARAILRGMPRPCVPGLCRVLLILSLLSPISATAQSTSSGEQLASPSGSAAGSEGSGGKSDGGGKAANDILNMDIEQLARTPVVVPSMDIPVTSVTKELSTVGRSAAAVFVITPEMIRRSGATCIPEALRMAPGLDVAQINSSSWAISCRGFNQPYSNSLLVLIDGRSVYNPDVAGVYWNQQDVLLEDVERIEVIRGPGGTLWGANAVNGVINIITKKAKDTQGAYVMAGGGTQKQLLNAVRYGGQFSEDCRYRVYGKQFEQGPGFDPTGRVDDAWRQGRFGFRTDYEPCGGENDVLTVQGDHYVGSTDNSQIPISPTLSEQQTGDNLLARWRHIYDEDTNWTLQTYYDTFSRIPDPQIQAEVVKTFDIDFQYQFRWSDRQKIIWGAGFRNVDSYFPGGDAFTTWFPTPHYLMNRSNQFVQDEIAVVEDRLTLTLGCKLEEDSITGLEYEPTARVLWTPDRRHSAWCAVSRAVRVLDRVSEQANITMPAVLPNVYPRVLGNPDLQSPNVIAYEIGFREQATERFSWDIATYYNVYRQLRTFSVGTPYLEPIPNPTRRIVPLTLNNADYGDTYGMELTGNYALSERWRLYAQYTMFEQHLAGGAFDLTASPSSQVYLRSAWDLREDLEFDLMARYVDALLLQQVPSYITMDLRLAWRPRKHLELAAVGQNLLQAHHWEFGGPRQDGLIYSTEVPRGVYGTVTWRR